MTLPLISVPTLSKYQHYKDRDPPWIKLHRSMLTDYKFGRLQDASKMHLIGIWLLASQMNNLVPADPAWIANRINATEEVNLNLLIDQGFIILASGVLAERKQSALVETEAYKATETEKDLSPTGSPETKVSGKSENCPYQEIVCLYHEILPNHPKVKEVTAKRKRDMKARWANGMEKSLETFRDYFKAVLRSRFLIGKVDPPPGRKRFMADFDFLMRESTYVSILEGKYLE